MNDSGVDKYIPNRGRAIEQKEHEVVMEEEQAFLAQRYVAAN